MGMSNEVKSEFLSGVDTNATQSPRGPADERCHHGLSQCRRAAQPKSIIDAWIRFWFKAADSGRQPWAAAIWRRSSGVF